ncbi:MAG TPA: hypothetical protein GX505_06845 [Clostridiales bacterium]|nr:hypothetical protein [Clostridiales bacterium]
MDLFREESVHKVNTGLSTVVYVLAWIGMIFFGILTIFSFQVFFNQIFQGSFNLLGLIMFVFFGGLTFLCFTVRNNQRIEYDYTFTNGILDIAKVINNSRRKKLLSANIKEFEIIAPASDDGFMKMLQYPGIKKFNYFLNRGGGLYYGIFTHNGDKSILVFEPSEEMLKMFKLVNPRNVKIN